MNNWYSGSWKKKNYDKWDDDDSYYGAGFNRRTWFQDNSILSRTELIKPYLGYGDAQAIRGFVNNALAEKEKVIHGLIYPMLQASKMPHTVDNANSLYDKMLKIWNDLPKGVTNDVFNLYYGKIDSMDFEKRVSGNRYRYQILDAVNDSIAKILTNGNALKSGVYTKGTMLYLLAALAIKDEQNNPSQKGNPNSGPPQMPSELGGNSGKVDEGEEGPDQQLQKIMNATKNQQQNQNEESRQNCEQIDQLMDSKEQESTWKEMQSNSKDASSKLDRKQLEQLVQQFKDISMNAKSIKEKIKKLLDKSLHYFSAKEIPHYESLINAESIDNIQNYEFLHPKLRKLFLEDVMVKETKKVGKIDVYVDISGSMEESCGIKIDGRTIDKMRFAKALTFRLREMQLINNLYTFDTTVTKINNTTIGVLSMYADGGTSLQAVINKVKREKRNALVITDCADYLSEYNDQVFIMGIKGASFRQFSRDCLEKYRENDQVCVFDGEKVRSVDSRGEAV